MNELLTLLVLCAFALTAGFVDSIAGGGGLIQLPALLLLRLDLATATLLGTNKAISICGTSMATWQYGRKISLPWKTLLLGLIAAFVGSYLGANIATRIPKETMRNIVLVLVVLVGLYTALRRDFGQEHAPRFDNLRQSLAAGVTGLVIGFYDGIFGPGTGTFLMFVFISWLGFNFLIASGAAKAYNLASNFAAIIAFASSGHVHWQLVLPMALCNMLGGYFGSRMAIQRGSQFVRKLFLLVVVAVVAKLLWDSLAG